MTTSISEIADGIYRLSTFVPDIEPPAGFTFNQFLVLGDEPLLFHAGLRKMFGHTRDALARLIPPERLRWISFGHFEADECGAMNEWLAHAPGAEVAHGTRALRGAEKGGMRVERVEIEASGKIVILSESLTRGCGAINPWDEELSR